MMAVLAIDDSWDCRLTRSTGHSELAEHTSPAGCGDLPVDSMLHSVVVGGVKCGMETWNILSSSGYYR